jgi:hypothetical protein
MNDEIKTKYISKILDDKSWVVQWGAFIIVAFILAKIFGSIIQLGNSADFNLGWTVWLFMPCFLIAWPVSIYFTNKMRKKYYMSLSDDEIESRHNKILQKEAGEYLRNQIFNVGIIIILLLLFALNPNESKFSAYIELSSIDSNQEFERENYYLFSIYNMPPEKDRYLGILNQFIYIKN